MIIGKSIAFIICGLLGTAFFVQANPPDDAVIAAQKNAEPPAAGGWGVKPAKITDPSLPHVLLMGDSIAGAYSRDVIKQLQGKANIDLWTTADHLGPDLMTKAAVIFKATPYDVIHFNESGLHAWARGQIPEGQYGPRMRQYIALIKSTEPQARLIWATTTPITVKGLPTQLDPVLNPLIVERNTLCAPIMQENGIEVDDLYSVVAGRLDLARGDRFHWNSEGFQLLADAVVKAILPYLKPSAPKP